MVKVLNILLLFFSSLPLLTEMWNGWKLLPKIKRMNKN